MSKSEELKALKAAAEEMNDELGEGWSLLADISKYSYLFSGEFNAAVEREIAAQHDYLNREFKWVTVSERVVIDEYKTLVHISELDECE